MATPDQPETTTPQAEQPVVTPEVKPAEAQAAVDPRKEVMRRTLGAIIEDKPAPAVEPPKPEPAPAAEEAKPEPVAEPEKKEEPAAPPAPEPAKPEARMSRDEIKDLVREVADGLKPAPAAEPEKKEEPNLEFLPEEQAEIELAKFAATQEPGKYKDLPGKFEDFFRRNKAFIDSQIQKNGEFDPESQEYADFRKSHLPKLSRVDRENLRVAQAAAEAEKRAEVKIREAEERMRREVSVLRVEPVIKSEVQRMREVIAEILPDDVKKQFVSAQDFEKTHLLESRIVTPVMADMENLIGEYYRLTSGIKGVDLDNPQHRWLNDFVTQQGEINDAKPEAERRLADGKVLVSRQRYAQAMRSDPDAQRKYSPLGDSQVVAAMQRTARDHCKAQIELKQKELEAAGYVRVQKPAKPTGSAPAPVAAVKPMAAPSPAASVSKSPGSSPEKPKAPERSFHSSILNGFRK
jgi:hypothetical protein